MCQRGGLSSAFSNAHAMVLLLYVVCVSLSRWHAGGEAQKVLNHAWSVLEGDASRAAYVKTLISDAEFRVNAHALAREQEASESKAQSRSFFLSVLSRDHLTSTGQLGGGGT